MELQPTIENVHALVDEIRERNKIDEIFHAVFYDQYRKESRHEELQVAPKDFKCMRTVHGYLNDECDNLMKQEYSLGLNKYVIDFCETTEKDKLGEIEGVIR